MSKHKPKPKPKPEPTPPTPPGPTGIHCNVENPDGEVLLAVDGNDTPYKGVQHTDEAWRYSFTIPGTERRWGHTYKWPGGELRAKGNNVSYGDGSENDAPLPGPGDFEGPTLGGGVAPPVHRPGNVGRISVNGRRFSEEGKGILHWRGITGFRLLEMIAHGRVAEAERFLDFCAEHQAYPRVLAMARHLFVLDPAEGRAALPQLLDMCARRGLFCEIVALADTASYAGLDFEGHLREIGEAADRAGNAIVEVGNEVYPPHQTQSDRLGDPDYLLRLARLVPERVPVSLGSTHGPEAESRILAEYAQQLPNGYATAHDIRTADEGGWKQVRHPNDIAWISDDTGVEVINDEPFKDDMTPGRQMATGAVCRIIRAIGDCFHYQGGLHALVPEGAALQGFLGRKVAWDTPPRDWVGQYLNAGHAGSPVDGFDGGNRCYSAMVGNSGYTVSLDDTNMTIKWAPGVRPVPLVRMDGATIWKIDR